MNLSDLRALDAAQPLTDADHERAAGTLERILATEAAPVTRRPLRRPLLIGAAALGVAAVAAAAVVLPGGRSYASWTPVPAALTDAEVALIGPVCKKDLGRGPFDLSRARIVLAERRGEYAVLLYVNDNPDISGACLAHNLPGSDDVDDVNWGAGGSSGPMVRPPAREYTEGALADFGDASITNGTVGADVTGVTVHAGEFTVEATVRDGRYAAWWPGPAMAGDGADAYDIMTFDITLRDGTVIRDARGWRGN
ncbi:hypothetical protein AB0M02_43615 [Actinoplanes sp. NPDC051861]|uniref:hypothetical protein n=1 Tax=Actinoplanes sp. NPDC051861 TaxID=3155170 RepID=UPI0034199715